MSATGRGAERQEDDAYITESWCVNALLAKLYLPSGRWLEPGAGDGAIVRAVQALRSDVKFLAVEKRQTLVGQIVPCAWLDDDFLNPAPAQLDLYSPSFAVAIGNPPYKFAREFIEQALKFSRIVAFLLRLDFLGSLKRVEFYRAHPADVYVLHDRPSFILSVKCKTCGWRVTLPLSAPRPSKCETAGCASKLQISTTDANEYGWFVWGTGGGKLIHLDPKSQIGSPSIMPRSMIDFSRCHACGNSLTHGHVCPTNESGDLVIITDVKSGETEAAAKARQLAEEAESDSTAHSPEFAAAVRAAVAAAKTPKDEPAGLTPGALYALVDGRLARFDGEAKQFSFFDCTQAEATMKIRLETKDVQAWPSAGKDPIECPSCRWLIAGEAAADAEQCPFCSARG